MRKRSSRFAWWTTSFTGHGLRWNVDERVQVFTNPLWVLALIPLYAVFGSMEAASYLLSAAASTLALGLVAWPLRRTPLVMVLGLSLPLLLSQAFTDYTSSGLENPFIFLFVALFGRALDRAGAEVPWKELCLCAALSAVTRADSFLLFLPALGWLWLSDVKGARLAQVALGASPLFAWLAFALFYYGTIFPNPNLGTTLRGCTSAQDYLAQHGGLRSTSRGVPGRRLRPGTSARPSARSHSRRPLRGIARYFRGRFAAACILAAHW